MLRSCYFWASGRNSDTTVRFLKEGAQTSDNAFGCSFCEFCYCTLQTEFENPLYVSSRHTHDLDHLVTLKVLRILIIFTMFEGDPAQRCVLVLLGGCAYGSKVSLKLNFSAQIDHRMFYFTVVWGSVFIENLFAKLISKLQSASLLCCTVNTWLFSELLNWLIVDT